MDETGLTRTDLGLFLELSAIDPELPAYRRLFLALRRSILKRHIAGGARVPSTRTLAGALGISRNTVKSAYELLQAEGYLVSRRGAGCYVADLPEIAPVHVDGEQASAARSAWEPQAPPAQNPSYQLLQPAVPALDQFPYRRWQRALQSSVSSPRLLAGDPQGDARLRQEIVRWLSAQRGMQADASQVVITSGSQQGLYLVANELIAAGEPVALELPGFPGTERVFERVGAQIEHFRQQDLDDMEALSRVKLMVITPSRNFPLGHTLPADRRLALLNRAHEKGSWLVEDDYDSEFSAGPALSALFSLDNRERVIYAGTFSRTLFPGLRIGYLVIPKGLVDRFVALRRIIDGGLSTPAQVALAEFMANGDYSRHLRRMKRLYGQRRQQLEQLLSNSALANLPVIDAGGGMHLCLQLPDSWDDHALAQSLVKKGVSARALRLYDSAGRPGLVLGFAADGAERLARGVQLLEQVVGPALSGR
ncbi:PLP-dependent aminotransferase family protein [Marinobacterium litorale]|uniref:MocR-like pyridoxine biosynthesis transcription factor PdxR n=1 Tax=Marinobacterium litorale TaxID=404770 RepID=UPI0004198423|nr:PLP-dependent aminotransferase family protein [Marinobacterium litorale]